MLVNPRPGTKGGPCLDPCDHGSCGDQRQAATIRCDVCRKPIAYEPFRTREVPARGANDPAGKFSIRMIQVLEHEACADAEERDAFARLG